MKIILVFTKIGTLSLVFLLCLLCLQSDGADIRENCTVNGDCTYNNGTCVDSTCGCVATYYIHVDGSNKICQLKINVNETCTNGGPSDQCKDPLSNCSSVPGAYKCTCNPGYYNSGGTCTFSNVVKPGRCPKNEHPDLLCIQMINPGDCINDNSCPGNEKCCKQGCSLSCVDPPPVWCPVCAIFCLFGNVLDDKVCPTCTCKTEINVNEICTNGGPSDQCKDPMSNCTEVSGAYKCTCNPGYYNNGGTCTIKINVDETCTNGGPSDQCKDPMSNCTEVSGAYKCTCNTGYYNSGGTCTIKINVDETCTNGGPSDQCKDPMSNCTEVSGAYKCSCNPGYYNSGGTCTIKVEPGGSCSTVGTTRECLDSNSECTTESGGNTCRCTAGYYDNDMNDDNVGGVCTLKVGPGGSCSTVGTARECLDSNSECTTESSANKCRCTAGYYDNDMNDDNVGGTCVSKKQLGGSCTSPGAATGCLDSNSICTAESGSGNKCRCTALYYDNDLDDSNVGGTCTPKKGLGGSCSTVGTARECSDSNSICTFDSGVGSNKCRCTTQYYDNDMIDSNVGGTCVLKKLQGGSCTNTGTTTECLDSNSVCTAESGGGNKCRCTTGYYDDDLVDSNVGGTCVLSMTTVVPDSGSSSIKGSTLEYDNTAYIVVSACSSTVTIILLIALVVTYIRYKAVQQNVNQNVNNTNKIEYNRHYCDLTNNILNCQDRNMI